MFLFRSLTTGLLGACVLLIVQLEPQHVPAAPIAAAPHVVSNAATIVDVAPYVNDVVSLIHLAPDEQVVAVGDRPVANNLAAGAAISATPRGAGRYVDLTVESATTTRRVLVLMH